MRSLSLLLIVFSALDWVIYPEHAARWLAYRIGVVLLLVYAVQPLIRRVAHGAGFPQVLAYAVVVALCFSAMIFESGGFRSFYYFIVVFLCWSFSVIAPMELRRGLVVSLLILSAYFLAGVLRGDASPVEITVHSLVVSASLVFALLGSRLATDLFLRQQRAELETQRLVRILEDASRRDALTGAFNRRSMDQRLKEELARFVRDGTYFCVLMVDLDRFKEVNDRVGHQAGDLALVNVSQALQRILRSQDAVFRFGGEEFMAIVTGAKVSEARIVAERLRRAIEALRTDVGGGHMSLTISIGFTQVSPGDDLGSLIARADAALYRAKGNGRNRVECADPPSRSGMARAAALS